MRPGPTPYDRSSQWLYQHCSRGAHARLLNVQQTIQSCQPLPGNVVQPQQLPDGLLEVRFEGRAETDLFLLEFATYPEARVEEQLVRDTLLVYLDRRVLPEVWVLVLQPRGAYRVPVRRQLQSLLGKTQLQLSWNVVELWTLSAEQLLAANEVGLVPLVPLTQFDGPVEPLLEECGRRIDEQAKPEERLNLLAVAQVFARLRYNTLALQNIFGGRQVMIESPLFQEVLDEVLPAYLEKAEREAQLKGELKGLHHSILEVLAERFGAVPVEITTALERITDLTQLNALLRAAVRCPDLEAFRGQLPH